MYVLSLRTNPIYHPFGPSEAGTLPASFILTAFLMTMAAHSETAILNHPTKRRIYEHLLVLPGDHFRSIVRFLGLGLGTVRHHMEGLVARGLVRVDRVNGHVRYYANGERSLPQLNRLYERHWAFRDLRLRVLLAVRRLGDARPITIARALGISRQLAAYHLAWLTEAGHVKRADGRYRT